MPEIFDDGDFSVSRVNGAAQIDRPFYGEGDFGTCVVSQPMMVDSGSYVPIALDTLHPNIPGAYFVGDEQNLPAGAGVDTFIRKYATIPQPREVPIGSMSHLFPAITVTAAGTRLPNIASIQANGAIGPGVMIRINFSAAHTVTLNQSIMVNLRYTYISGGSSFPATISGITRVSQVISATSIAIDSLFPYWQGTLTWNTSESSVWKDIVPQRDERTLNTAAKSQYTYFLPGVTPGISTWTDIPVEQSFAPILTASGNQVNYVSDLTTPSANEYVSMVSGGDFIIISSAVYRWMGNIYVRETQLVMAR